MKKDLFMRVVRSTEEIEQILSTPGLGELLLKQLEVQFGCSFGTEGFLAGQAVSSAVDQYLGLVEGLQYKDLDIFVPRTYYGDAGISARCLHESFEMATFKNWLFKQYPNLSSLELSAAYHDLNLRQQYLDQKKFLKDAKCAAEDLLSMQGVEASEATDLMNYSPFVEGCLTKTNYKVVGIDTSGVYQHIYHTEVSHKHCTGASMQYYQMLCTKEELDLAAANGFSSVSFKEVEGYTEKGILKGFDINGVMVGISLKTGKIYYLPAYVDYLHDRQLRIVSTATPFQSMVRALSKQERGACYFNKEEHLDTLLHVLGYLGGEPLGCYIPNYEQGSLYNRIVPELLSFETQMFNLRTVKERRKLMKTLAPTVSKIAKSVLPGELSYETTSLNLFSGTGMLTTFSRLDQLSAEAVEWLSRSIDFLPVGDKYLFPAVKDASKLSSWKQIGRWSRVVIDSAYRKKMDDSVPTTALYGELSLSSVVGVSSAQLKELVKGSGEAKPVYYYAGSSFNFPGMPLWNAVNSMILLSKFKKPSRDKLLGVLLSGQEKSHPINRVLSENSLSYLWWSSIYKKKLSPAVEKLSSIPAMSYAKYGLNVPTAENAELDKQARIHIFSRIGGPQFAHWKTDEERWFRAQLTAKFSKWLEFEHHYLLKISELYTDENRYARAITLYMLLPEIEDLLDCTWEGRSGFNRLYQFIVSKGEDTSMLSLPDEILKYPVKEVHNKIPDYLAAINSPESGMNILLKFFSALLSVAYTRTVNRLSIQRNNVLKSNYYDFSAVMDSVEDILKSTSDEAPYKNARLSVKELILSTELLMEGLEMSHCVGGYASAVSANKCRILSYRLWVTTSVGEVRELKATAEIYRGRGGILSTRQLRSQHNGEPCEELHAIHQEVVRRLTNDEIPEKVIMRDPDKLSEDDKRHEEAEYRLRALSWAP